MSVIGTNVRKNIPARGKVVYQRPMKLSPWAIGAGDLSKGTVWVSMKPKKIIDQYSKGAGTYGVVELNTEFLFQAPLNLNENIVHHWEAYESVASRIAQKARSLVKLGEEAKALGSVGLQAADSMSKGINLEGKTVEGFITGAYNNLPSAKIPNIKVDTPMYYTNSDRRQIVFEFVLFSENIPGTKTEDVLINPIKELMKFSSPDLKSGIQIEFPYMWEIKTEPVNFIHYTTCALTAVQPTWNSPYVNHMPSSVNLQLTFQDLSPLYAGTIEEGSIINVINGSAEQNVNRENEAVLSVQNHRADGRH